MYPQHVAVGELLRGNQYRGVVATRNAYGVPHLSPEFIWHWDENSLWFSKFPGSRTAENLARFPETSVSIVDWANFRGLQLKGIAQVESVSPAAPQAPAVWSRLRGAGITEVVRLDVMEVYDVIPRAGADLGIPLWWRKRAWETGRAPLEFVTPSVKPLAAPAALRQTLASTMDSLRGRFVPNFVGTVGERGVPNISPRFVLEVGEDYWFYGDGFRNKTFVNAARPSPVCIAAVDWDRERGYLAHGWVEMRYTGEWLEKIRRHWDATNFKVQAIQAVLFHPESVDQIGVARPINVFAGRPQSDWVIPAAANQPIAS